MTVLRRTCRKTSRLIGVIAIVVTILAIPLFLIMLFASVWFPPLFIFVIIAGASAIAVWLWFYMHRLRCIITP